MALAAASMVLAAAPALAGPIGMVCTNGTGGANFALKATTGTIETPDGNSIHMWSYADEATGGRFQSPGPVLCVNQGDLVTVTLDNPSVGGVPEAVSIVFAGQDNVLANGLPSQPAFSAGALASLTATAVPGGSVTYSFVAANPGTYLYESGTDPTKQVEMGLYGALVVRPRASDVPGGATGHFYAYDKVRTEYDPSREYLLIFHELDPDLHQDVEAGGAYNANAFHARYFTISGRTFPDTIQNNNVPWLPTQPYGSLVRVKPYDAAKNPLPALVRMVNAGLLNHPFHPHGFHIQQIAQDGRLFETSGGGDASTEHFGDVVAAGSSQDTLFTYVDRDKFCSGTSCTAAGYSSNPLPSTLVIPNYRNLFFKDNATWYSGSPYLGVKGTLPNLVVSYNICGEFYFPWHSHALNEFVNFDVAFGGLATLLRVDPLPGCTAFPSTTKINAGTLKGGTFANLSALEAPATYYQASSAYQVNTSPSTTVRTPGITSTVSTSIPIQSAAGFPANTYYIQIDSEKMRVTAGFGTATWTVARGQLGTAAATHATGAVVRLVTAVADWYGGLTGVAQGALNLKVSYQGKNCGSASTTTTCAVVPTAIPTSLRIWNWRTSTWTLLQSASVASSEVAFNDVAVPQSPAGKWSDYLGTGLNSGQVRVQVFTQLTNPGVIGSPAFASWGNFMKLTYDSP